MTKSIVPHEIIENKILLIRGQKVILDRELAYLYGVETRALNQIVSRNIERFPKDFMFQLSTEEFEILKSQIVTSSWGGVRKLLYAFTEHGVLMLSNVLKSKRAISVSIQIINVFIKMRELIQNNAELLKTMQELEKFSQQTAMQSGKQLSIFVKKLVRLNMAEKE